MTSSSGRSGPQRIALSFDVDWAADEILADTFELLEKYDARATFFATHETSLVRNLDRARYEVGVHPNFLPELDGKRTRSYREVLREAKELFPDIVGVRSHGVVTSGPILAHAAELGFLYESNMYIPRDVAPFCDYDRLIRVPMYWSDYRELLVGTPYRADSIVLSREVTPVFAFHPIHVFINSVSPAHFQKLKHATPAEMKSGRHDASVTGAEKGIRDFLIELLQRANRERIDFVTLRELAEEHVRDSGGVVATHPHRAM